MPTKTNETKSCSGFALWVIAAALLLMVIAYVFTMTMGESGPIETAASMSVEEQQLDTSTVQAVFLNTDQVYFGTVTEMDADTIVLEDVYYLQVEEVLQPAEEEGAEQQVEAEFSIMKLGTNELHKPQDKMVINKDQVLFWENLEKDSEVVKAINEYSGQ